MTSTTNSIQHQHQQPENNSTINSTITTNKPIVFSYDCRLCPLPATGASGYCNQHGGGRKCEMMRCMNPALTGTKKCFIHVTGKRRIAERESLEQKANTNSSSSSIPSTTTTTTTGKGKKRIKKSENGTTTPITNDNLNNEVTEDNNINTIEHNTSDLMDDEIVTTTDKPKSKKKKKKTPPSSNVENNNDEAIIMNDNPEILKPKAKRGRSSNHKSNFSSETKDVEDGNQINVNERDVLIPWNEGEDLNEEELTKPKSTTKRGRPRKVTAAATTSSTSNNDSISLLDDDSNSKKQKLDPIIDNNQ
jgi:hypothetical protein